MSDSYFKSRINKRLLSLTTGLFLVTPVATFAQEHSIVQMVKRNASNFAIDGGRGGENTQNVYIYNEAESNVNQQWYEIDRGNGYFSYQKVNTELCLDGNRGGERAQNVYLWSCGDNNFNQHWLKVDMGAGHYRLEKRNAPGFSIDGGMNGENEQNVHLWSSNNLQPLKLKILMRNAEQKLKKVLMVSMLLSFKMVTITNIKYMYQLVVLIHSVQVLQARIMVEQLISYLVTILLVLFQCLELVVGIHSERLEQA